ncbi:hypothetical protein P9857_06995 [Anoxybacillus geothermalis]|nr:hypothetical protein [Anoxybacillus geothermalis]
MRVKKTEKAVENNKITAAQGQYDQWDALGPASDHLISVAKLNKRIGNVLLNKTVSCSFILSGTGSGGRFSSIPPAFASKFPFDRTIRM